MNEKPIVSENTMKILHVWAFVYVAPKLATRISQLATHSPPLATRGRCHKSVKKPKLAAAAAQNNAATMLQWILAGGTPFQLRERLEVFAHINVLPSPKN